MIKKCKASDAEPGKPWCLYTKDGSRLLGRHATKEAARKQEAAIQATLSEAASNKRAMRKWAKEEERRRKKYEKDRILGYGLFKWNRDGKYEKEDALKIYKNEKTADKAAKKMFEDPKTRGMNVVVRTIYKDLGAATVAIFDELLVGMFDAVASELERRGDMTLAEEVDRQLDEDILSKPGRFDINNIYPENEDLRDMVQQTGFDWIMKRDSRVADIVRREDPFLFPLHEMIY